MYHLNKPLQQLWVQNAELKLGSCLNRGSGVSLSVTNVWQAITLSLKLQLVQNGRLNQKKFPQPNLIAAINCGAFHHFFYLTISSLVQKFFFYSFPFRAGCWKEEKEKYWLSTGSKKELIFSVFQLPWNISSPSQRIFFVSKQKFQLLKWNFILLNDKTFDVIWCDSA